MPRGGWRPLSVGLGSSSPALAVSSEADDATAAAAMAFIEFWNTTESQITWALGSGFPPNRTDISSDALSENPYTVEFGAYADTARFYLTNVQDFTTINANIFEPALQRFFNGEGSAAELLGAASQEAQAVLDEQ